MYDLLGAGVYHFAAMCGKMVYTTPPKKHTKICVISWWWCISALSLYELPIDLQGSVAKPYEMIRFCGGHVKIPTNLYGSVAVVVKIHTDLYGFVAVVVQIPSDLYGFVAVVVKIPTDLYGFVAVVVEIPRGRTRERRISPGQNKNHPDTKKTDHINFKMVS